MKNKIFRFLLFPFGLFVKIYHLGVDGSRDLSNKTRFSDSLIDRRCIFNEKTTIAKSCHILENASILNSKINSFTYIGKNTSIQNSTVGLFCSIASDVTIGLGAHPLNFFSTSPIFYRVKNTFNIPLVAEDLLFDEYKPILIGNDVWIGSKAILLDGINVGNGSVIAAGSVVTKDVPPYAIVAGVPAKVIKYRFEENKINKLLESQWWDKSLENILSISEGLNE